MSLSTQSDGQTGFVQFLEQVYKQFRANEPSYIRPLISDYCELLQEEAQAEGGQVQYSTWPMIRMLMKTPFVKNDVINVHQDHFSKLENVVGIAMMPHYPAYFLENLLSNAKHEDYELAAETPSWKSSGGGVYLGTHYAATDMRWIVENIYEAYFPPFYHKKLNLWDKEFYDYAQALGAKVNLLRSDKYTDSTELKVLDNLVHAVSRIQGNIDSLQEDERFQAVYNGCDYRTDYQELYLESTLSIWFELCHAIAPLAGKDYKAQCEERSQEFGPRRHRFVVDPAWDPRAELLEREHGRLRRYGRPLSRMGSDDLKKIYKQVMFNRAGGRDWYEIEDENQWYVTPEDVKKAFGCRNLEGPYDGFQEWIAMVGL